MTTVQTPNAITAQRGLGWDIDSPYAGPRGKTFPIGSFGHTGWTGTSIWIDPTSQTFLIFLSNRNHPSGGDVRELRHQLGTLAAEASRFPFSKLSATLKSPPSTKPAVAAAPPASSVTQKMDAARPARAGGNAPHRVENGIDVLVAEKFASLRGLKLGLITNHTGRAPRWHLDHRPLASS